MRRGTRWPTSAACPPPPIAPCSSVLDEKLLKTIPLVAEANAMSDEMGRGLLFEPKLMANQHKARGGRRGLWCPRARRLAPRAPPQVPLQELKARYGMATTGVDSAEAALAEQVGMLWAMGGKEKAIQRPRPLRPSSCRWTRRSTSR